MNTPIQPDIPQLEALLTPWRDTIGKDYDGYRNHVYRMVHCCLALAPCNEEEKEKLYIAACFHDIGIWTANTLDYLPPSVAAAADWLRANALEGWQDEIGLMISEHHKLSRYPDKTLPLVERFRQADLVDFSLGLFRCGLDRTFLRQLKRTFPNAGFHPMLVRRALGWFLRHPLNPAPMMKR